MGDIIEKDLSYSVNGCIYDVHNELGAGLREECYQKAMEIRLAMSGLPFIAKPYTRRELSYLGCVADVFAPDLIVADRLILELKALPEGFSKASFRQTINYLKVWNFELGLLVNFADINADIQRVVFHETIAEPIEDFNMIRGTVTSEIREKLIAVREVILAVHREIGLGYSDLTYRKLLEIGMLHRGLVCQSSLIAEPTFLERPLPTSPITPILIEGSILVQVEAIVDGVTARALRTMQTHMVVTNAEIGIVASFGKSMFEICAVRSRKSVRE